MAGLEKCWLGDATELQAASLIAAQGFLVASPWGHAHSYDFITDADGVLKRVQVRHANYRPKRDRYEVDLRSPHPRQGSRVVRAGDYDVLAAMADASLYLIPAWLLVDRSMVCLRPPGCRPSGVTGYTRAFDPEVFREAWTVLKERG